MIDPANRRRLLTMAACWCVVACFSAPSAAPAQEARPPFVFDLPKLHDEQVKTHREAAALLAQGNAAAAEKKLDEALGRVEHDAVAHYQRARARAIRGDADGALTDLLAAVEFGLSDKKLLAAREFDPFRKEPRFTEVEKAAALPRPAPAGWKYRVSPAAVVDGEALVSEGNTSWNPRVGAFHVFFKLDSAKEADAPLIATGPGELGDLLRKWRGEGTAAGNRGDLYDNHDKGHSELDLAAFPQFTRITFAQEVKDRNLHHGLQNLFFYNGVTIGNSSTAWTGNPLWRSMPRFGMTHPRAPATWYLQFLNNHLYVYPEHRDYDAPGEADGHGDLFPANTPYVIISRGSSGSDQPFLQAAAGMLAAFRPKVKAKLTKEHLLMPTLQMILRRCYGPVKTPEDYLTGKAHPTAFDGKLLDAVKMATMAHEIQAGSLPPMAQIEVVEENLGVVGRDYFDAAPREKLFDTPCAVARIVKSTAYERRLVVSAEKSKDADAKPLKFHWVLLQGDPAKVSIKTLNEQGSRAEIVVGYHERRPIEPGSPMVSSRVDIGIFVHNGDYYSPPAFLSLSWLDNETRVYDEKRRIVSVDYADPKTRDRYVDPLIDSPRDWRDDYRYADSGELLGWTRTRGDQKEEFNASGELIVKNDDPGRPTETRRVSYSIAPHPTEKGRKVLKQRFAPERF